MTSLVLSVVSCSWPGPTRRRRHPTQPGPRAGRRRRGTRDRHRRRDRQGRAVGGRDPSYKAENSQETLAVRGRKRPLNIHEPATPIRFGWTIAAIRRSVEPDLV